MGQPAYTLCAIQPGAEVDAAPAPTPVQVPATAASPASKLAASSARLEIPDAELLAAGFAAHPKTLRALQRACRFSDQQAAAACLVSPRTYRRWRSTGNPDPTAVRLLAVLAGYVPWVGWDGWEVHNGYLFPPGYSRGGIPPSEFFALVFYRQQVSAYQQTHATLKAQVAALQAHVDTLEQDSKTALLARVQALQEELSGFRALAGQLAELSASGRAADAL